MERYSILELGSDRYMIRKSFDPQLRLFALPTLRQRGKSIPLKNVYHGIARFSFGAAVVMIYDDEKTLENKHLFYQ